MFSNSLVFLLTVLVTVIASPLRSCPGEYMLDPAVTRFRRYVQIDTSQEHNIERAVEFWRRMSVEMGLPFHVFRPKGLPICLITLLGSDPSLSSILLNSHMDVVPAVEEEWTYPPFSAHMEANGDIYGRGTQDDKDVSMQYIEALRRLKENKIVLNRTLHISLMPDEETGGFKGMKPFAKSDVFKALNVGFVMDEGMPSPDETVMATYEDRRPWQIQVTVTGEGGHGFSMPEGSAMEKATRFINAVNAFRDEMQALMRTSDPMDYGGYTSVNINTIHGGYKTNVIPSKMVMVVDIRLASSTNVTDMERLIKSWLAQAGNGTSFTYIRRDDVSKKTPLDNSNPFWVTMRDTLNDMNIKVIPVVLPATSDMLVIRNMGIPAVGFSPKFQTTSKIHNKNEFLNAKTFLRGIDVYYELFKKLGCLQNF